MRVTRFHVLLNLILLLGGPLVDSARAQEEQILDEIVAVVDGEIILRSDVDALVLSVVQQQQVPFSRELFRQALQEVIDQKVLVAHAKRDTTLEISPEMVSGEIDSRISRLVTRAGGEQRLETAYGKTIAEIKADMTPAVRDQLMAAEYQRRALQNVKVTPSEVRSWFNQIPADSLPVLPEIVRVAHIVRIPEIDPAAREEAMDIISTLRDSVASGNATIEELSQFSDDAASVADSGRYQDVRLSELVPEFGAIASTLEPGELSQVFETRFGIHFMRLNRRTGDIVDFNHILIQVDDSRVLSDDVVAFLESVRDTLQNEDIPFEVMAKRHSEEPRSAARGGFVTDPRTDQRDLVVQALGPQWQRTLIGLQEGEISEPAEFELLDGRTAWHIVLLQERIRPHPVDLVTDYGRIEELVLQEKRELKRQQLLQRLRDDVHIDLRIEEDLQLTDRIDNI